MKKKFLSGLAALLSAAAIGCGKKDHAVLELPVNGYVIFPADPTSEYYDIVRGTTPYLIYEGPLTLEDALDDDYIVVGRGRYNPETNSIDKDTAVRHPAIENEYITVEHDEIIYEFIHIDDDNDGDPTNNILILQVYY